MKMKFKTIKGEKYLFTDPCYVFAQKNGEDVWGANCDVFTAQDFGAITVDGIEVIFTFTEGDGQFGAYFPNVDGPKFQTASVDAAMLCVVRVQDLIDKGYDLSQVADEPQFIGSGGFVKLEPSEHNGFVSNFVKEVVCYIIEEDDPDYEDEEAYLYY